MSVFFQCCTAIRIDPYINIIHRYHVNEQISDLGGDLKEISCHCSTDAYFASFLLVCFQVVVLSTRPLPIMPQRSMSEVSFVINKAERKALRDSRRSSLIGWDSSLEDVQVRWRRFLPTPSSLQSIKCFIFYHKINLIKILCPGG